ncbi:OmpA family protein [Actinotalea sp. C106]|uniref:OmpA family protein n=1 Tax=Actinotalea sp. C106 TaxID=2908644 RepID=UPI0020284532|nr:OmpA family protein [Actinotalea sp. C106]
MRGRLAAPGLAVALLVATVAPAAATTDPDLERLEEAEITAAMLDDAVLDLSASAQDAVLPLVVEGSVIGLERTTETEEETVVTLTSDLLFEFGKADLTAASTSAIAEIAQVVPQGAEVQVDGYTDSLGGDEINLPLSERRAQAVADAIATARPDLVLTVEGHGSADPVAPNEVDGGDNPGGRAQNRRVELTYPSPPG